jgi:hypothetical protein
MEQDRKKDKKLIFKIKKAHEKYYELRLRQNQQDLLTKEFESK